MLFFNKTLINFLPELPHLAVAGWTLLFAFVSLVASAIFYAPISDAQAIDESINISARIEAVKEAASMWRTISLAIFGGYLGFLIPWLNHFLDTIPTWVSDDGEQLVVRIAVTFEISVFTVYVLLGPVVDALLKSAMTSALLFRIKS